MPSERLAIHDFAQIRDVQIQFRDLTVLVGAQGTGKSLVLQWLKAAIDGRYIVQTLRDAGQEVSRKTLIDLIFGVGMSAAWRGTSQVGFDGSDSMRVTVRSCSRSIACSRRSTGNSSMMPCSTGERLASSRMNS